MAGVTGIVKERLATVGITPQSGVGEDDATSGNERLTAATGAVLIVLLLVLGVTLLRLRSLLSVHLFVGLLLIPPVLLKMASTGYRFVRYYTHDPHYRLKGPPPALMRVLAPLLVISTVVVFASGVALLLIGPSSRDALLPIHKVSFIVWGVVFAVHVLGHLAELPRALEPELRFGPAELRFGPGGGRRGQLPNAATAGGNGVARSQSGVALNLAAKARTGRLLSLAGALVGGAVLAVAYIPQFGPWLDYHRILTGGH
jgi:hypothetical protein